MYDDTPLVPTAVPAGIAAGVGGSSIGLGTIVAVTVAMIMLGALIYRFATKDKRYES